MVNKLAYIDEKWAPLGPCGLTIKFMKGLKGDVEINNGEKWLPSRINVGAKILYS